MEEIQDLIIKIDQIDPNGMSREQLVAIARRVKKVILDSLRDGPSIFSGIVELTRALAMLADGD